MVYLCKDILWELLKVIYFLLMLSSNQSHKFKKCSRSLTSKIILLTFKFVSIDCCHTELALDSLWSVKPEFDSGKCGMHGLALALALALA